MLWISIFDSLSSQQRLSTHTMNGHVCYLILIIHASFYRLHLWWSFYACPLITPDYIRYIQYMSDIAVYSPSTSTGTHLKGLTLRVHADREGSASGDGVSRFDGLFRGGGPAGGTS